MLFVSVTMVFACCASELQGRLIRFVDDENAAELCTLAHALNAPLLASAAKAVIFRHFAKVGTIWGVFSYSFPGVVSPVGLMG